MDVLFYILDNVNGDNLFIGTNRAIAEATQASTKTVNIIIKKMVEADLMTIKQRGVYMVKPSLLMKGDNVRKHRLIVEYENVKQQAAKKPDVAEGQITYTEDGKMVDTTTGEVLGE